MLSTHRSSSIPRSRRRDLITVGAVVALGVMLTIAAVISRARVAAQHETDRLAAHAQHLAQRVQARVVDRFTVVRSIAALYRASDDVTATEFAVATRPFLARRGDLRMLIWAEGDEDGLHVREVAGRELTLCAAGDDVSSFWPDGAFEDEATLALVSTEHVHAHAALLVPVRASETTGHDGVAIGIIDVDALTQRVFTASTDEQASWRLRSETAAEPLASHGAWSGEPHARVRLALGDQAWILEGRAQTASVATQLHRYALTWGAVGTVLTALLALLVHAERGQTRAVEAQVRERTAELALARDAAQLATRCKSEFLTNMSHELRTPMMAILGAAELLDDPALSAPERDALVERINASGGHLVALINDLLDLSSVESGQLSVRQDAFAVRDVIERAVGQIAPKALARGVTVDVRVAADVPAWISSDATRLTQIVVNLLSNAERFTDAGRIDVEVTAAVEAGHATLAIDVIDTGCGIETAHATSIFELFNQADGSLTRMRGGTGLGLAISRRCAQLLGGDVTLVRSSPGAGAHFRGVIAVSVAAPRASEGSVTHITSTALAGTHVLLVDDCEANQRLLAHMLRRAGADVTVNENGQQALDTIERATATRRSFDLILMDMQMPILDGYTATRRLRAAGYDGVIIACTAHAMVGDRERCLAAGCNDYLTKPVARATLIECCATWGNDGADVRGEAA